MFNKYYVFYTGCASTPCSIGIAKKEGVLLTGKIIQEIQLWDAINTGKQIRELYQDYKQALQTKCDKLNSELQ